MKPDKKPDSADNLWAPGEVADRLAVSIGYLAQMRYQGTGPAYIKMGGKAVRYRESDIQAWFAANLRTSTARTA